MISGKLDPAKAKRGGESGGRIDSTGAYIGEFSEVKVTEAPWGGKGYEFKFESVDGRTAEYISIMTVDDKGKEIEQGENAFQALLCCAKVKEYSSVAGTGQVWDPAQSKMVEAEIEIIPELMQVPIGVVLQKKLYTKRDGSTGTNLLIHKAFNSETRQTSAEMLDRVDAEQIDKVLEYIEDWDARKVKPEQSAAPAQSNVDFDDDIPF